jgi:hypothetical protein
VVECAALEMRYRGDPIGGSNPSLSAILLDNYVIYQHVSWAVYILCLTKCLTASNFAVVLGS